MSPAERVDVGDRLGEGLRGFLGQVVPDAALDQPALICLTGPKDAASASAGLLI
jgi:hypothetical protein